MSFSLERFDMGLADSRTPWMPNDALLQACMEEQFSYPSPYPKEITPSIALGRNISIVSREGSIDNSSSIIHSLEKVECVAFDTIKIHLGSVIIGKEISLKAPIVKIYDEDDEWPIRTTLRAKQRFSIEADQVIIEEADIPPPESYSIKAKSISIKNVTANTQWLIDLIKEYNSNK